MPTHPDPYDAYRIANGIKKTTLEIEKQIQDLDLNILKQLRELTGLDERERELKVKATEATSDIVRDFHKDSLRHMIPDSRARASAWLAINRAKKAQLLVEYDINTRLYGNLQKDIWTCDKENYESFRQLLAKME